MADTATDAADTTAAAEPEELIEAFLVSRISAASTLPVDGMISPASAGTVKNLSEDTFVGVKVDVSSQDGDYRYLAPFTFNVEVTVHVAASDDPARTLFRDECRRIRAALLPLSGDGCSAFDSSAFACDEFLLGATSTDFDGGEDPVTKKAYTATLKGRVINQ